MSPESAQPAERQQRPPRTGRHRRRSRMRRTRTRRTPGRRWPERVLAALIIVVAMAFAGAVSARGYLNYRFSQVHRVDLRLATAPAGAPFTVLIAGSDSRSGINCSSAQGHEYGCSQTVGGQRSDVIILLRVDPASGTASMLSIPRDTWVELAGGGGHNRINAAYNSGPQQLIDTITQNFGITINHYVEVTFQGFQDMVNALGGITMNFPMPVRDAYSGLDVLTTGCQHVDGTVALQIARARHLEYREHGAWYYDGTSDYGRIERQHQFFRAVINKAKSVLFSNPFALNDFVSAAMQSLTVDSAMSPSDIEGLAGKFRSFSSSALPDYMLPTTGWVTPGGADVLLPRPDEDAAIIGTFLNEGRPAPPHVFTTAPGAPSPAAITVNIQNGSGVWSTLGTVTSELQAAGFHVGTTQSWSASPVVTTVIRYGPQGAAAAGVLQDTITGLVGLQPDPTLPRDTLTIVVGSSFGTITPPPGAPGTTSTTGPPATTPTGTTTTTTLPKNLVTAPWDPVPC